MKNYLYPLLFVFSFKLFAQDENHSFGFVEMQNWFAENAYSEVNDPSSTSLSRHLGNLVLRILQDDADQVLNFRGQSRFEQAFLIFQSPLLFPDYIQLDPVFAGHFDLILSAAPQNLSERQKLEIYIALQMIWAAMAASQYEMDEPEENFPLDRLLEILSSATVQAPGQSEGVRITDLIDNLKDLGIPIRRENGELNPLWFAWDIQTKNVNVDIGHRMPQARTYLLARVLEAAEKKTLDREFLKSWLLRHWETEPMSEDARSALVEVYLKGRPDNALSFERALRKNEFFKANPDQLPREDRLRIIYTELLDLLLFRVHRGTKIQGLTRLPANSPAAVNEMPVEEVSRILEGVFWDDLSQQRLVNENPNDGNTIKNPRLELLDYLIRRLVKNLQTGALRVSGLEPDRLDAAILFQRIIVDELSSTEVFQAQVERILPRLEPAPSQAVAYETIAAILAAWASGAQTRPQILETCRQMNLLTPEANRWLSAQSTRIFAGDKLSQDFQNWVYYLPRDQYLDAIADPASAGELTWIVSHLTSRLTESDEAEDTDSLLRYLVSELDWSNAPADLKDSMEFRQDLLELLLKENFKDAADFAKRAPKSEGIKQRRASLSKNYLQSLYEEALVLLRIKLQSPSLRARVRNSELMKEKMNAYLFRQLGEAPANAVRSRLVELASSAVFEGQIYFNPTWLSELSPDLWISYVFAESLKQDEARIIRRDFPNLAERFKNEAPQLDRSSFPWKLVGSKDCRQLVRSLTGRQLQPSRAVQ